MTDQETITRAQAAWADENYQATVQILKSLAVTQNVKLDAEALQLLQNAYGKLVFARYTVRREIVNRNSCKESSFLSLFKNSEEKKQLKKIDKETESICTEALGLLDRTLDAKSSTPEEKVICLTMRGNMLYFLCRVLSGKTQAKSSNKAIDVYREATELAKEELPAGSYARLNLALNYSNFCCDILHDQDTARAIAQTAYFGAIPYVDSAEIEKSKQAQAMAILKINFMAWNRATLESEGAAS